MKQPRSDHHDDRPPKRRTFLRNMLGPNTIKNYIIWAVLIGIAFILIPFLKG